MSMNLDAIFSDFNPSESPTESELKKPLTVWISAKDHARYERIQTRSGKRFGKKLREVILAALDTVEKKVS